MKKNKTICKILCIAMGLVMASCATACSSSGNVVTPTAGSNVSATERPTIPDEGYKVDYTYDDGFEATVKTVEDSKYMNDSVDILGNRTVHFITSKPEAEVNAFYDSYFATLQRVKPKDENDDTIGYYDKDNRMIIYNLIVWTADGNTNYKMGCEQCEDLSKNETWVAA